ncbi:hypothetical protein RISK_003750 [Rhodopirellula islandica]|uniref:Uncharacterized protein n=1 Tax=Rhodopirellula islandica TaxID=595434 RepID=A0A0J1EF67_RHOIS|nr:hypothetical protein RISK_003750 [Rhodopirellula islandica]
MPPGNSLKSFQIRSPICGSKPGRRNVSPKPTLRSIQSRATTVGQVWTTQCLMLTAR